jgi:hypothetical protein
MGIMVTNNAAMYRQYNSTQVKKQYCPTFKGYPPYLGADMLNNTAEQLKKGSLEDACEALQGFIDAAHDRSSIFSPIFNKIANCPQEDDFKAVIPMTRAVGNLFLAIANNMDKNVKPENFDEKGFLKSSAGVKG